jgi:hypothetical protein
MINIKILIIILFISILFFLINNYLYSVENFVNEELNNLGVDIIIARYNEDLKWTLEYPFNQFKYIVYNKGNNENFEKKYVSKIIKLPNVGKCDHTYLYHIIENYDKLSDITVFFPGSIDLKHKKKIAVKILKEIYLRKNAIFISLNENDIQKLHYKFKLDYYKTKHALNRSDDNDNTDYMLKKSNIRPFGLWFQNMFGNLKIDCLIYYGIFSIDKNDIIQHPKSRYETLIQELSDHPNPEVGHYLERSWCAVFHPMNKTEIIKYNKI